MQLAKMIIQVLAVTNIFGIMLSYDRNSFNLIILYDNILLAVPIL